MEKLILIILKTMIKGINGDKTSNSNLSSIMEKLMELLKNDSVKDKLDTDSLKSMEKLLSNLSANLADDNTEATKDIKSGIKNLMSEISNMLDNKQNQSGKVLTLEDMLNKNYSQDNKDSSTENESNKNTASKDSQEATKDNKEVSKEDKFLNSLIDDDNDSSLNKINLFASRTQAIQNQGVDTVRGLTINKATFADDLIKDVKFMSNNALKELTVKINPGNLGEITIKLIQEDGVMKANSKNTELMNLLNKLGIKEEDIKSNGEVNSDILQTMIEGINGDSTSNSNLSSGIEKLRQLLQTDSVKDGLDTDSLKLMQKLLSNLSANIADDNTKATKDIKSGIKNLMSEISNMLDNKQNQNEKVLTLEDMLNKNYSQDNKESSTENERNNATASKDSKEVSKEDKFLNSLIDDDKDSSLNKINLFASRTQTIQNQSVDTVRGLTINKATFADDLIKDVKFMSNNSLKELTVKINPGNLGEITIKLVQEDGVMKANLKANSKETTALLSQNLADIKKQIGEQNIKIADVNIELYQDDTTFFSEQGFGRQLSQEQENSNTSNSENGEINTEDSLIENIQTIDNGNINFLA